MPEWITPLLCPDWGCAIADSFSRTASRALGDLRSAWSAAASPTMPPPMTTRSKLASTFKDKKEPQEAQKAQELCSFLRLLCFLWFLFVFYRITVTLTWTLVQQHWKPPPPSPLASLDWARKMYSPGALNFAVVDVFPSLGSTVGLSLSKVTAPAPLNILQIRFAGGPWRGRASGGCFPSSLTHTSRERGSPTLTL